MYFSNCIMDLESDTVFALHWEYSFWKWNGKWKLGKKEVLTHREQKRRGKTKTKQTISSEEKERKDFKEQTLMISFGEERLIRFL